MVRLILLLIFLLLSLLTYWRAPALPLWYMAILVAEFSWAFVAAVLLLLFLKIGGRYQMSGTLIGIAALLSLLSVTVRAMMVSANVDKEFDAAYNITTPANAVQPYSIWRTFNGANEKQMVPQELNYVTYGDTSLKLDFYKSVQAGKRPCVVVIHGGSWKGGDSKQLPELNTHLAKEGYHVASINYRLAPGARFPAPIDDVAATLKYLKANAEQLQIDTNQFVLLGRSAGAEIALVSAYTLKDASIKGVINYYGPADMIWGYHNPANRLVFNSCEVIEDYIGGTYKQLPELYAYSSSVAQVSKNIPPTLSIHGVTDPLCAYEHSTRLEAKLKAVGAKHYLLTMPWATHGCDYTLYGPSGQLATYTTDRFLKMVLQ
ncbi:MAG: alpha/beta hydrolase [Sphingobacteriales bacterium]|nr:MAG: alpha/beta hydrolase [Sphingobacteriales bacterium]